MWIFVSGKNKIDLYKDTNKESKILSDWFCANRLSLQKLYASYSQEPDMLKK